MEARDPHSIFRGTGVPGRRTSQCKGSEVAEASRCSSKRKLSAAFIQLQSRGWTYREGGGKGGIKVAKLGSPPPPPGGCTFLACMEEVPTQGGDAV